MVAWSVPGEGELLGGGQFILEWEQKLEKLDVGKPLKVNVPRLVPRGVDRAGARSCWPRPRRSTSRRPRTSQGLRPIDPQQDLIAPVNVASRAFEFHDAWTLPVAVTRYELEQVKRTSIDRAVCRMVLTPADKTTVQAVYRIRSVLQRLTVKLPAEFQRGPRSLPHQRPAGDVAEGQGRRIGRAAG